MGSTRVTGPRDGLMSYGAYARLVDSMSGQVLEDEVVNGVAVFMEGRPLRYTPLELLDSERRFLRAGPGQRTTSC
jgi:hypothetical protein